MLLFALCGANSIYEGWRSRNFLKTLKGEIVYVTGRSLGEVYKIKASGEDNQFLYHNPRFTVDYIRWQDDGRIQFLVSMGNSALPTGNEYKLVTMDSDGKNVKMDELPLQPRGDEASGERFQKYVDQLFKIERLNGLPYGLQIHDGLYVFQGSVIYLAENGKLVKVYNHMFYDLKFNRGPDTAVWSPDKKFIAYNNGIKGLTITDRKGSIKVNLPVVRAAAFDWKY